MLETLKYGGGFKILSTDPSDSLDQNSQDRISAHRDFISFIQPAPQSSLYVAHAPQVRIWALANTARVTNICKYQD